MNNFEILGHITFILIASSFLVKDIFYLRILAILSCFAAISYNYLAFDSPIWLVIYWQIVFILINSFQIGLLLKDKLGVKFTEEEQELYDAQFRIMSPVEFMKLIRHAEWMDIKADTLIIKEGQPLSSFTLIYNGIVELNKHDHKIATAKDGSFLGEVEFFSDRVASINAISVTDIRLVVWKKANIEKLLKMNLSILISLNSILSESLANKLVDAN